MEAERCSSTLPCCFAARLLRWVCPVAAILPLRWLCNLKEEQEEEEEGLNTSFLLSSTIISASVIMQAAHLKSEGQ